MYRYSADVLSSAPLRQAAGYETKTFSTETHKQDDSLVELVLFVGLSYLNWPLAYCTHIAIWDFIWSSFPFHLHTVSFPPTCASVGLCKILKYMFHNHQKLVVLVPKMLYFIISDDKMCLGVWFGQIRTVFIKQINYYLVPSKRRLMKHSKLQAKKKTVVPCVLHVSQSLLFYKY